MRLARLLEGVPDIVSAPASLAVEISSITSDSRQVTPGALFVAYEGVGTDGHRFAGDAIGRGAAAIAGEHAAVEVMPPAAAVPYIQVKDGRAAVAWLNAAWYGHPSRHMTVVGVTGTDGKTTTCNLLYSILKVAGIRAGMISTVNAVIGDRSYDTGLHTTTPDSADVQRYLAQMLEARTEVVVLETTSHGLAQHRVTGVDYDIAVVTNITHEHLDFHGSYEAYRDAKAMLFRSLLASPGHEGHPLRTAVLNVDDTSFEFLAQIPAERRFIYTAEPQAPAGVAGVVLRAASVRQEPAGMRVDVEVVKDGDVAQALHLVTRLVGRFNVSNLLAAVGAAEALGVSQQAIEEGVAALVGISGRMERIDRGQHFTAIVDFAHTPNALAAALSTARDLIASDNRVIVVFGSAGLRDREKRRLMGAVAVRYADYTVITAEDPRTEDLTAILGETADEMAKAGRVEGKDFVRLPDRQAAILHAVRHAQPGDILLVCGKGHEQSMCFGAVEHPWRDQDALSWALDTALSGDSGRPPFVLPTWSQVGPEG